MQAVAELLLLLRAVAALRAESTREGFGIFVE